MKNATLLLEKYYRNYRYIGVSLPRLINPVRMSVNSIGCDYGPGF